ncbi:MAG: hypothetical protein PHI68_07730 [Candidatus Cloacimonetes bacterium]|nr:hypothetical protein [Candidatus Cloacimonadota bacterium]
MKSIFVYEDDHTGKHYFVIPHIREIHKVLGSVVITFANGDKRDLDVPNPNDTIAEMLASIEQYYCTR